MFDRSDDSEEHQPRKSGMLVVMSGLPGVGKSTLADALGKAIRAPVLSVDPIEAAMWRRGISRPR